MESKKCVKCETVKSVTDFNKRSRVKDGYDTICRPCYKLHRWKRNPDVVFVSLITEKMCNTCNQVKHIEYFRTNAKSNDGYYHKCKDCWKPIEWNKEKQKQSERKYVENNKDKMREKWKRQGKQINRRIRDSLNHRISEMLQSQKTTKANKTVHYVGCNVDFLKSWFEFLFDEDMSWANYGEWHIDHVMPCGVFNLEEESDQLICFNWRNLRPCWKLDNIQKGDKIIDSIINDHNTKVDEFLKINPLPTLPGDREEGTE